jgi:hypothetical protein
LFRSYEPVDTQKIVQTVIPPLYVPGGHDTFLAVGVARAQCMAQTRLICSIDQKYFIINLAVISNTTEYVCFMFAASMLVVHNIYGHTIRQGFNARVDFVLLYLDLGMLFVRWGGGLLGDLELR